MSKQWLFTEGGEYRASLSARDCGIEGIAHGSAIQFDAQAAELQRQNSVDLEWLEENRERFSEIYFGDGGWTICMRSQPGSCGHYKEGKTLHEAISAAREARSSKASRSKSGHQ